MIRSAAKNHRDVAVVVDPADYPQLQSLLTQHNGVIPRAQALLWAGKAFAHTAAYDSAISDYLAALRDDFPDRWGGYTRAADLRYGENPHQRAARYAAAGADGVEQLQGKALSYNNYLDFDAALALLNDFPEACVCAIIKHTNPCGVACGETPLEAYERAYAADALSAFGGIIAVNRPIDEELIHRILAQQFVELIVAPEVSTAARQKLSAKPQVRLLRYTASKLPHAAYHWRSIDGGFLVQQRDNARIEPQDLRVVSKVLPDDAQRRDLVFAARVVKHVKSNAIVCARDQQTLGIGAGQMSRIDAMKIAGNKAREAKLSLHHAVLASDAFFPFTDSIDYAAQLGIAAVVQPGGSLKDDEVIADADQKNIAMAFTGRRSFRH